MGFNFLALPREIRDLVYAYVVQDVRYRHAFVTDKSYAHPKYGNVVRVTLENAPGIHLLPSHSQFYTEYRHTTQSFQRSARIRLDTLMSFPTRALHDGIAVLDPVKLYKPTTLTVVIDDWSKGMDSTFSFHDAKDRFWGQIGWIADHCWRSVPSVVTAKIIIKEKDGPSCEVQSQSFEESIAPTGPFLTFQGRGWDYLLSEPEDWLSRFLLLKECRQASRIVLAPSRDQIAIARVTCLVYTPGSANPQASWDIDEVSELWPRTSLQPDLWTWHGMNEVGV